SIERLTYVPRGSTQPFPITFPMFPKRTNKENKIENGNPEEIVEKQETNTDHPAGPVAPVEKKQKK
ncbi:MAG: hypothetical protein LBU57_03210, partial [Dysgonamonadaceae bacterium]|nr:hypothetical protein [Dysgonamonadaceae bacterium]